MRQELRDELSELLRDGQAWAATISISLPWMIAFLLLVQGNPNVFLVGLWVFILLSVISGSVYILLAKKKEQGIYRPLPNGGQIERSVPKYRLLQPFARRSIFASIVAAVILMGVPPLNRPFRAVVVGTITPTLTQTPLQIFTFTPPSTLTGTPSPRPVSDSLYYMIVLDASINMQESFDGQSKWAAALGLLDAILPGLNPTANYGLVVVGGSGTRGTLDPCGEPSTPLTPFTSRENIRAQIGQLIPEGGGSFYNAFILARNMLEGLPANAIKTMIFITGSRDTCESRDEWRDLERVLDLPTSVDFYSEIIVLDEDGGITSQSIADRINSLSVDVNVQAPQDIQDVRATTSVIAFNNVTNYVNTRINESNFTPVAPIPTDTQVVTPSTPILPTEIIVVPTSPTLSPYVMSVLPSQIDVFSQMCFLRNHARVYAQFYQGQAGISAELVNNGRTNQMLRLDFSNISYNGANYAGWEVRLGPDENSGIDLSNYSSLEFYIRGMDGGEEPNVYLMMPITNDYQRFWNDVEQVVTVSQAWQRVVIPLSHFASSQESHQQVDLRNIQRIQIMFEWYPEPRSGRIFIDDLCVQDGASPIFTAPSSPQATMSISRTPTPASSSTNIPASTSSLTHNPTLTALDLLSEIDKQLKETFKANIAYIAPRSMKLHDSFTVELSVNPSSVDVSATLMAGRDLVTTTPRPPILVTDEIGNFVTNTPEVGQVITREGIPADVVTSQVEITNRTRALLTSTDPDAFNVKSLDADAEQVISSTQSTTWRWSIIAEKVGTKTLDLVIYQLVKLDGNDYWRTVETYRAEIAVEVTPMQWLQELDWKWILGIVVTLLLVPGFWRWFDQRSRQNASTRLPESKYAPLKKYFANLPKKQREVTLTFAEIEAILNDKLPDSARKYKGWWANDIRGRHVQAAAWLDAGWKMESVDLTKRRIYFVKA